MAAGVRRVLKDAEITIFPMSDGGGGFLDAMLNTHGGTISRLRVARPCPGFVVAGWGMLADGKTAVIEMKRSSGLQLVLGSQRNPLLLTSYGTGQVILRALEQRPERIIIGLGDTATVDGGAGILEAMRVHFYGNDLWNLKAIPVNFGLIRGVDFILMDREAEWAQKNVKFVLACDVDNPLLGPRGAAAVFGPQKGAKPEDIPVLEANLTKLADVLEAATGRRCRDLPGAGAAGGAGWALACLFDAEFVSGAELVLQSPAFQAALARADLVITGEGALDRQSLAGKGPVAVARAAHAVGKRVIAFAGRLSLTPDEIRDAGFSSAVELPPHPPEKARAALAAAVARSFRKGA